MSLTALRPFAKEESTMTYTVGGYLAERFVQIGLKHHFVVPGDYNLVRSNVSSIATMPHPISSPGAELSGPRPRAPRARSKH